MAGTLTSCKLKPDISWLRIPSFWNCGISVTPGRSLVTIMVMNGVLPSAPGSPFIRVTAPSNLLKNEMNTFSPLSTYSSVAGS